MFRVFRDYRHVSEIVTIAADFFRLYIYIKKTVYLSLFGQFYIWQSLQERPTIFFSGDFISSHELLCACNFFSKIFQPRNWFNVDKLHFGTTPRTTPLVLIYLTDAYTPGNGSLHACILILDIPVSVNILQWLHNGHYSVSNHQPRDCLLNRLFRSRSKKTSKLRVTSLCAWNSPGAGEFPAQMASNAENVSIWWRHHDLCVFPSQTRTYTKYIMHRAIYHTSFNTLIVVGIPKLSHSAVQYILWSIELVLGWFHSSLMYMYFHPL